ncbi:MAG: helix-turn-helix transcriptional regulator [Anaerolineales bacterium]|nr:helix-turn-helix transcriptional regulator [Anaerolineales bacterium]
MLDERLILRNRIIGLTVRSKREQAGITKRQCAEALGVSTATITAFETGRRPISLPELEALAYLFDIPVQSLWGAKPEADAEKPPLALPEVIALRQRIVGARLRQARIESEYSKEDLADMLGCSTNRIAAYEYGQQRIPLAELEVLADGIRRPLGYFLDHEGPLSQWERRMEAWQRFQELPNDVQEFVLRPSNVRYLEVAMRLASISAEELRAIAEGLLEITY